MRRAVPVAAAAVVVASLAWLLLGRAAAPVPDPAVDDATAPINAPVQPRHRELPEQTGADGDLGVADGEAPVDFGSMHDPWAEVDLDEVRAALPDNLYWSVGAPTQDERILEERAAERARWNVEYGKVLSGNASEEEIRAYYDRRARLAGDYVEFATYMLDHYGDTLPERDVALLTLARRLNHARLEEIPRKIEEAYERKRAQDAAREAWRAQERDFGTAD